MKMKFNDIVKEVPANLIPTYKMLGWEEVNEKPAVKPKEILPKKAEIEKFADKKNKEEEE